MSTLPFLFIRFLKLLHRLSGSFPHGPLPRIELVSRTSDQQMLRQPIATPM
jgi:hypothetical protein